MLIIIKFKKLNYCHRFTAPLVRFIFQRTKKNKIVFQHYEKTAVVNFLFVMRRLSINSVSP